jgi:hypothetical protein
MSGMVYDRGLIVPAVLEHVRAGGSVQSWCAAVPGRPSEGTWRLWCDSDPTIASDYARAREARGHHYGERVADLAGKVERGEMTPDAARVAIDAYKWASGRMAPKVYGDKAALELTGKDGAPLTIVFDSQLADEEGS